MPIYEYYCPSCDLRFEKLLRMSAAGQPQPCPTCSTPAAAAVTRPARITGATEESGGGFDGGFDGGEGMPDFGGDHGHSHGPGGHTH